MSVSPIPSHGQCLALMRRYRMPEHIQRHSFMVAEFVRHLVERLQHKNHPLNVGLLHSASLLHDIGKARSLQTGENHGELGAQILEEWGYLPVAPIVREHTTMDSQRVRGPLNESILVNYADKRVRHDKVVTLEERFLDLARRYGKSARQQAAILSKLSLYEEIERRIFD